MQQSAASPITTRLAKRHIAKLLYDLEGVIDVGDKVRSAVIAHMHFLACDVEEASMENITKATECSFHTTKKHG